MTVMRFGLAHLMALVVLAAIGLAVLRDPSPARASALFTTAVALPLAAILKALSCRAEDRLPWIGFALFGLGFLRVSFDGTSPPQTFPATALWDIGPQINPDVERVIASKQANAKRSSALMQSSQRASSYRDCSTSLSAICLAVVGYVIGLLLSDRQRPPTAPAQEQREL